MEYPIENLAVLSYLDQMLDELNEEFGDLPKIISEKEAELQIATKRVDETQTILENIRKFCANSKITLVELKDKDEKLTQQQFDVRNNKEFDAISNEIKLVKEEHVKLSDQLRSEGLKEENLLRILEDQKKDFEKLDADLDVKNKEADILSSGQNTEVKALKAKRTKMLGRISDEIMITYNRVRGYHPDAAVLVRKNSCSGCYSAIPAQKIVELRNNRDKLYTCENCGRILTPEDYMVDDDLIDTL